MGWDPTPRCDQNQPWTKGTYPYTPVVTGNTPAAFRAALAKARDRAMTRPPADRVVLLNAWNEWAEGAYLEPDTVHGDAYLDAIRDVFGTAVYPAPTTRPR